MKAVLCTDQGEFVLAEGASEDYRMSFALFCPSCGQVWGRVYRSPTWYSLQRHCRDHTNLYAIGGSFFQNYLWLHPDFAQGVARFPRLAEWEFERHLEWAEKFPSNTLAKQGELQL
jgi:hypothetical protein